MEQNNEIRDLELMKLDKDNQLHVAASLLGYETYPVDIDTFLDDPYYMGNISKNLYPFWRDLLRKIFPTPIHTSTPILVFTGALGTGKSTAVRFAAEYMKYRLSCLKDPYSTFGFVPGKYVKFSYFHKTGTLAQTDFLDVISNWEDLSPFFTECHNVGKLDYIEQVCDTVRSNANIGSDVLFYNFSELNFIPYEKAWDKISDALTRWSSRFQMLIHYFGLVIIDTSAREDDSIADDFIKSNPYGDLVRPVYTNRWLVREHLHYYGQKGWFKVYKGDSVHGPFIVRDGMIMPDGLDPDRFMDVPEECRADFEFNLIQSLQDIGGVSTSRTDRFIQDPSRFEKCFDQPQFGPNIVTFDFFDKTDKFIYKFDRSISSIPTDKVIFIRADIGVVTDNMGLAIAYFNKWVNYDIKSNLKQPDIIVPLAVGISRPDGEETPIYQLEEFIKDLNQRFEVGCFTADQFASRQLFQDLLVEKIPNQYLSVDRSDEAYIYTKTLMMNGLLHLPNNEWLKNEIFSLRRVGNKIDHASSGDNGKGSKDIADSVSGVVYNLYQYIDKATLLSTKYKVNQFAQQIETRTLGKDTSVFQQEIQGLFG